MTTTTTTTDLNQVQEAVHAAICETSPQECLAENGKCIQAVDALPTGLRGWVFPEGCQTELVCETCRPEVRLDRHRTGIGSYLAVIETHKHE